MKLHPKVAVAFEVSLTLNESEARALDAVCGYGPDAFLSVFYEKLGKAYLEPHAHGFRSLCASVSERLAPLLSQTDDARRLLDGQRDARAASAAAYRDKLISESASRTLGGSR